MTCTTGGLPATDPERRASSGANGTTTLPAGTSAIVLATNPARLSGIVQNETGGTIYIGYDATTATTTAGIAVPDGGTYETSGTAAIFAYSATGGTVRYAQEMR